MTNLRSDALITRRIVCSFIDFLNSVKPAPGVDDEALEVAKDCLSEFFQLNQLSRSDQPEPNLLVNLYTSHEANRQMQDESKHGNNRDLPTASAVNSVNTDLATDLKSKDGLGTAVASEIAVSRDELFGQFFAALEKIHFFRTRGGDEHVLLERVTSLFHDAINEIKSSGCKTCDQRSLAEALKTLGNKAMQSNAYADAIERYTCAIALCDDNAVYYCNRAAAYTQTGKYDEAVRDSLKAIDIDPTYSKAYSRLGFAYYSQGNYSDAINRGFKKALELDPDNSALTENLKAAEQKLREQQGRRGHNQGFRNHFTRESRSHAEQLPPFASVSFDASSVPPNLASMFMNGMPPPQGGSTPSFSMGIDPTTIASMFTNLTPNAHQQPNSQTNTSHGTEANPPPFPSMSFDPTSIPASFADIFANPQGQPQEDSGSDRPEMPEGSANGSFSFSLGGNQGRNININLGGNQNPDELMGSLRAMMGMFSGSGPQADQPGTGDGRPDSS